MNRNYLASFCIFFAILHLSCGLGDLWFNNPATKLLEIQLQNAFREQQQLATRLIRAGIQQTQLSSNQIQVAKVVQTTAAITLASKGLFDLNNIGRLIASSNIRQCYQQNRFSFGDAIDTAKNQVGQCLSDKVNEGKSIIESARNNIQSAFENIGNAAVMMAECNKITIDFPSAAGVVAKMACLQEALITIKSNSILLPINLGKRILEATESISSIEADIARCSLSIIQTIATQASYAAKTIVNCINENNGASTEGSSVTTMASAT